MVLQHGSPDTQREAEEASKAFSLARCPWAAIGTLLHFRRHVPSWFVPSVGCRSVAVAVGWPPPPADGRWPLRSTPASSDADAAAVLCKKVAKTLALWSPLSLPLSISLPLSLPLSCVRACFLKAQIRFRPHALALPDIHTAKMGEAYAQSSADALTPFR